VGVQSFQPEVLRALGREEVVMREAATRDRLARAIERFWTVNVDMMFGVAGQTPAMLRRDIEEIRQLEPDQVTFYPLMRSHASGGAGRAPARDLYALIVDGLSRRYRRSSAWCFSRAEASALDEYISARKDFAGLGSGSFGYVDGVLYANSFSIQEYLQIVGGGRFPVIASKRFPLRQRGRYHFLMSLFEGRLDLESSTKTRGRLSLPRLRNEILLLAMAGGVRLSSGTLRLSERGEFFVMLIMREFFAAVGVFRELCRAATIQKRGDPT